MIDLQQVADRLSLRFPGLKFRADLEDNFIFAGQDVTEVLGVILRVYIRLTTNGEHWISSHSLMNQHGDDITQLTRKEESTAEGVLHLAMDDLTAEIGRQQIAVSELKKGSARVFKETFDGDEDLLLIADRLSLVYASLKFKVQSRDGRNPGLVHGAFQVNECLSLNFRVTAKYYNYFDSGCRWKSEVTINYFEDRGYDYYPVKHGMTLSESEGETPEIAIKSAIEDVGVLLSFLNKAKGGEGDG
jgi:hypothetical protein